jgi:hypothetical protein
MANTTRKSRVKCVTGNALTVEVNAGKIILPTTGNKYIIVGGWMRALGGNAATATGVNISDTTATTPVVGVAVARAALTQNTVVDFDAASDVTRTTYGIAHKEGKGLQIIKDGSDLATATSIDYCIKFMEIN